MSNRPWLRAFFVTAFLSLPLFVTPVGAQENPFSINGSPQTHGGESVMGIDQIDPLSGNLLLVHTDLVLPGNAGLDVRIARYYNSNIYRRFAQNDLTFDEPSWVGVGWRLHFGRVIRPDSVVPGELQIEMPDGSRHAVYQIGTNDPWWRSADFYLYNPTTHVLKLPNGLVYTFGHLASAVDGGQLGAMRYVTQIRDPFDNTLTLEYFTSNGHTGGVREIQQDLGNNQVRTVTFECDPTTRRLSSMSYNGRTWTYQYLDSQTPGHWMLNYVNIPRAGSALRRWTYAYGLSAGAEELTLMKSPTGAEFQYSYDTVMRTADTESYAARVVWRRVVPGDADTPAGTWIFAYNQGEALNETHVQGPAGRTAYHYNGIGTAGPFNAWRTGTLARRSRFGGSPEVELERETLVYERSEVLLNVPVTGPAPWSDDATYRPLVNERVVARGNAGGLTHSWTTWFDYRSGENNFNDYGQAWRITQWPWYTAREIRRTFVPPGYFTPYIVGRLEGEVTKYSDAAGHFLDTEYTSRGYTYDPATGFVTSASADGVTTDFTPSSRGNVGTATDARSKTTSFQYAWGAVSRIETSRSLTVRTIPGPDPAPTAETVGKAPDTPLTTTYTYDALGRLWTVTPPGSTGSEPSPAPTTYAYDDTGSFPAWTSASRGYASPTVVTTYTDAFGRTRRTESSGGTTTPVKQVSRFDAEGREVFRSATFTGAQPPTRGTRTSYDALHRVTKVEAGPESAADPDYSATTYSYSGSGMSVTDPNEQVTHYSYAYFSGPGDGRLVSVTDAKNQVTQYEHRLTNTLTKATGPGCAPGDTGCTIGAGPVRTWTYTPSTNRLAEEFQPESGLVQYSVYDEVGNVKEIRKRRADATFETTTLTYDDLNRPATRVTDGGFTVTWTYDSFGRTTAVASDVTTSYGFDAASGRPTARTDARANPNGWTFTTGYAFDGRDRLTGITYANPGARQIGYSYDDQGRLTGVTNNGTPFATTFDYDAAGRLDSYVTGAVTHTIGYTQQDRIALVQTAGLQGPNLSVAYTRDRAGNVAGIVDGGTAQSFIYDNLHRLTSATGPWGTLGWEYDPTGNRTKETGGAITTYQYDAATNRLTSLGGTAAETFTYDGFGRLTQDSQGTYTYRPDGAPVSATRTGMTATYLSDGDGLRAERTVNGQRAVSVRGLGGQVLSEFEADGCEGSLVWRRDLVYAGGRLLGSIKNATARPTLAFTTASSSVGESAGTASLVVQLITGSALGCAVSVSYQTGNGTATAGQDYTTTTGTVTFPVGSVSGATQTIVVPILDDLVYEGSETFAVSLATPIGADLGAASAQTVTITDNEAVPALTINDVTVTEGAGATAVFTVSVSPVSAQPVTVSYQTADQTAVAGQDYTATSGVLTIPPQAASATITVPLLNDPLYEPAETFTIALSNPSAPVTIARATGQATILDNPRVDIDPAWYGQYLADLNAGPDISDWLVIGNPHAVAVTARLTWVRPDGTDVRRQLTVPAGQRVTVSVGSEPGIANQGDVSVAVQWQDLAYPLVVEHSAYWGPNWQAGRSTEGVTPAPTWYLAEGSTTVFNEWITVFNPTNAPIDVTFQPYSGAGPLTPHTVRIPTGPGRFKVAMRDWIGSVDHGTRVTGQTLDEQPVGIVVERTITWEWAAGQPEGHSTPGVSALSNDWYFAEGDMAYFATFFALLNPGTSDATVRLQYLHANGQTYTQDVTVGAGRRATAYPGSVPAGAFGCHVTVLSGPPIAAERLLYGGPNWTISHAGVGSTDVGTAWDFTEGANSWQFETYLLLANPNLTTAASVNLTFTRTDGTVITSSTTVPAGGRVSLWTKGITGLSNTSFRTVLEVTNGVGIVAERATYWPLDTGGGIYGAAAGSSSELTATASGGQAPATPLAQPRMPLVIAVPTGPDTDVPAAQRFNPYAPETARGAPPRLYQGLLGYPGGSGKTLAPETGADAGPPGGLAVTSAAITEAALTNALTGGGQASTMTLTVSWFGAHLTGGRRR